MKAILLAGVLVLFGATTALADSAPPGSYQKTCSDISYDGTTLKAQCKTMQGAPMAASLAYPTSCIGDIGNINGVLACAGPNGSYAMTCRNMMVQGTTLSGECQKRDQSWIRASLANFQGFHGDITNCDGMLQNGGTCK